MLWCLAAAALFGASTPAAKTLLGQVEPFSLAGLLYLGAALAVAPFSVRGSTRRLARRPRNLARLAGAVIFGGVLGPVLLLFGLRAAPAGSVSLWLNMESMATAVLGWLFFREDVGRATWLAVVLICAASVMLSSPDGFVLAPAGALLLLACCCWGLDNNFTALIDGLTPPQITLVKGLAAGTFNLLVGALAGEAFPGGTTLLFCLLVGAFGYGVSLLLYVMGAHALGAIRSQMLFATSPFIGASLAWIGLHEPVQTLQLASALLMAAGLALMLTSKHAHPHRHAAHAHTHVHSHDDGHHRHGHSDLPSIAGHVHPHEHEAAEHAHPHDPDLHHRHKH